MVNSGIESHRLFTIDNHVLKVIASDLVPIEPYTTEVLRIGVGQRYDVIVEANSKSGDFWLRSVPEKFCSASNNMQNDTKAVIRYDPHSGEDPMTSSYNLVYECVDEDMSKLVPVLSIDADGPQDTTVVNSNFSHNSTSGLWKWTFNGTSFLSKWEEPSM